MASSPLSTGVLMAGESQAAETAPKESAAVAAESPVQQPPTGQNRSTPTAKSEGPVSTENSVPMREPLYNRPLFFIVTAMLVTQLILLIGSLWFQYHNYASGIALAQQSGAGPESVSLILVYSRAWDFAVTKTVSLFLGYMVLYTGALYVLRSADTSYELTVSQGAQQSASLKTSSPGLVLVTLGGALIALVLQTRSEVGLQVHPVASASGGTESSITTNTSSAAAAPSESPAPPPAPKAVAAAAAPAPAAPRPAAPAPPAAVSATSGDDHRVPKLLEPR